jgi:hypothetical protein
MLLFVEDVVVFADDIRGTLIVAVTELADEVSMLKPFSNRFAKLLMELAFDRGGGAIVNVADIFGSFPSSSFSLLCRSVFRSGELIV